MIEQDCRDLVASLIASEVKTIVGRTPVWLRVLVDGDDGRVGREPEDVDWRGVRSAQIGYTGKHGFVLAVAPLARGVRVGRRWRGFD